MVLVELKVREGETRRGGKSGMIQNSPVLTPQYGGRLPPACLVGRDPFAFRGCVCVMRWLGYDICSTASHMHTGHLHLSTAPIRKTGTDG